jgi:type II secretory pathway pseudopilin PulG
VVISIIGVVTSALAFVVAGAQERAKELRTRSQLKRIESILQREIQDLLEARIPVRVPPMGDFPAGMGAHRAMPEGALSRSRRFWTEARRVDLLYRFPYRAELINPTAAQSVGRSAVAGLPTVHFVRNNASGDFQPFHAVPSDLVAIRNLAGGGMNPSLPTALAPNPAKTNSAELLYAILQRIWVDGEPAISLIRESEIADTDNDGILEIVDVWGSPIYFRLEVQVPVRRTVPATPLEGLFNIPLDQYSAWMTQFELSDGQTFVPTSFAPEVFSPERIRVVLYSSNVSPSFDPDNLNDPRALDFAVNTL